MKCLKILAVLFMVVALATPAFADNIIGGHHNSIGGPVTNEGGAGGAGGNASAAASANSTNVNVNTQAQGQQQGQQQGQSQVGVNVQGQQQEVDALIDRETQRGGSKA